MMPWTAEDVERVLSEGGLPSSKRSIEYGLQFTLSDGTKVNCYQTGKVSVQGKDSEVKRGT